MSEIPKPQGRLAAFGTLLRELRGQRSVQQVVDRLQSRMGVTTGTETLYPYEYGRIERPDPVILWGLAELYNVPFAGLVAVLKANREYAALGLDDAKALLEKFREGPSPAVAAETLERIEAQLTDLAAEIAGARLGGAGRDRAETRRQTSTPRRPKAESADVSRKVRRRVTPAIRHKR